MSGSAPVSQLAGWRREPFSWQGVTHDCYERGEGPGVVLLPELPGISPEVTGLAQHLVDSGFTVVVPSLYGTPGAPAFGARAFVTMARACVSREFLAFATGGRRPVADYLRALAREVAARTPGAGVGVVGLCFSGGFALAAAVDDTVLAAVMSQPSLPLPLTKACRADAGLSEGELGEVVRRTREDDLCVLGMRFTGDALVPAERFDTLRRRLGSAFEYIELDSRPGNPDGFGPRAHSVITHEVRETPGHPAFEARERTVAFLRRQLAPTTAPVAD
ncbi:dienelactone hydrolase family protein [Streptomyces antimicrobicus]|uniref:Dienelactone hydrolase family protein n=1 Tax=Streptomyces antimicrobicus TaxID=2883108 RepID=A0ABS8BAS5_9ACTN|nr:dienelactone hydrolase family protein [Streptomyces antimicrobicus]MCB5181729.1 dienelactone hydrolase family protein [Streptomyces antimicrobicus]